MASSYVVGENMAATVYVRGPDNVTQTIKVPDGAKVFHSKGDAVVDVSAANGETIAYFSVANILGVVIDPS